MANLVCLGVGVLSRSESWGGLGFIQMVVTRYPTQHGERSSCTSPIRRCSRHAQPGETLYGGERSSDDLPLVENLEKAARIEIDSKSEDMLSLVPLYPGLLLWKSVIHR